MWTVYINDRPAALLDTAPQLDQAFANAINQSPQLFNHILATYGDDGITIENLLLQTLRIRFETDSWVGEPFSVTGNPAASAPVPMTSGGLAFAVCMAPRNTVFWVSGLYPYEFVEAMGMTAGFLDGDLQYPPRNTVFWVSGLYPYEFVEAMGMTAGFLDGDLQYPPYSIDAMGLQAGVMNGSLSSGFLELSEKDAMGLSGGFSDGTLRSVFISTTLDKEAINISSGINDGTLKVVLVTNTMQTEAIGLSAGFNNGTLS